MPIAAAQAVGQIGQTVATIADDSKRRKVELALSRLSSDEQKKLNQQLTRTQSKNERLALLVSEINKYEIERQKTQSSKQTRNAIIVVGASLVFLITIVLLVRNKK